MERESSSAYSAGRVGHELLYRDREPTLEIAVVGRPWSFDGDGALFRLVSEAYRVRLAYLFDPVLAVHTSKEIIYWDHRAQELKLQEQAGRVNARLNSGLAQQRADDLQSRLARRLQELEQERHLSPLPPVVVGGALIVPAGLLARLKGERMEAPDLFARERRRVEDLAMRAVMATERLLGYEPRDVSRDDLGYDFESRAPAPTGSETRPLRFLEVKGRIADARTVTITQNEILTALNKPEDWILALVEGTPGRIGVPRRRRLCAEEGVPASPDFAEGDAFRVSEDPVPYGMPDGCVVRYVRRPFQREPDFGVTSVNYDLPELMARAEDPA